MGLNIISYLDVILSYIAFVPFTLTNDGLLTNSRMAARKRLLHHTEKATLKTSLGYVEDLRSMLLCMISNNFPNKDVNANRCVSGLIGKLFILPMYRCWVEKQFSCYLRTHF